MVRFALPEGGSLVVGHADLTRADVDAVVNAANPMLLGGGGVDGALHRAAGPKLLEACRRLPAVDGVRCRVGEARLTPGFELPARFVIHTVGPVYARSADPHGELAASVRACLALAKEQGLRSIAFPAISCGAYGFPVDEAAEVMVGAIRDHAVALDVTLCLFGDAAHAAFVDAARALLPPAP